MKKNDTVICIKDGFVDINNGGKQPFDPRKGKHYTVKGFYSALGRIWVSFKELPLHSDGEDNFYPMECFRNLDFTNISLELAEEGIKRVKKESNPEKITVPQIERVFSLNEEF